MKSKGLLVLVTVTILTLIIGSCTGGGQRPVLITEITVVGEEGKDAVGIGETLQMIAQILPANPTNPNVTWSVENSEETSPRENRAEITQDGVLTGLSAGAVIVKATAQDGSGEEGTKAIMIESLEIFFQDPVLEQAVRDADGYTGNPTGPIYKSDVLGITSLSYSGTTSARGSDPWQQQKKLAKDEWLFGYYGEGRPLDHVHENSDNLVPRAKITNLEGIQHLVNLQRLEFWENQVSDISPLQYLVNLQELNFDQNQVSDILPLQNLVNLQWLWFEHNQVSDVSPLQSLVNLELLWFDHNQVSDISPLQYLVNLQELYFDQNQVSNISPLQNLVNLQWLWFSYNQVSNIQPLVNNVGLGSGDEIRMRYNNLDLAPGSENMNDINTLIGRGVNVYYDPQN